MGVLDQLLETLFKRPKTWQEHIGDGFRGDFSSRKVSKGKVVAAAAGAVAVGTGVAANIDNGVSHVQNDAARGKGR